MINQVEKIREELRGVLYKVLVEDNPDYLNEVGFEDTYNGYLY